MRTVVGVMALCLSVIGLAAAQGAPADGRKSTSIPAQELSSALQSLAKQRDFQIVCRADLVKDLHTRGVSGDLTADEALSHLLQGTGLTYRRLDDRTVTIVDASASTTQNVLPLSRGSRSALSNDETSASSQQPTGVQDPSGDSIQLEEIVVTATKREANIQNLPTSISALSAKDIDRRNLVGMGDYLNTVPGVSINDMGAGRNSIVIRGIGVSELDQNVTGTYFGEVPLTSLAFYGNADIKLVDMSRIEVLRGPQGTLYGAGAMGGAVRSIPEPPNPRAWEGRVATSYSGTAQLGGDNTSFEGMVNAPLLDGTLTLRAVGYKFRNSGFYQNRAGSDPEMWALASDYGVPQLAVDRGNVGNDEYVGGRLSVLWTPTDKLRATLIYLNQELDQEGFPEADVGIGDWSQARLQMPALRFGSVSSPGGADHLGDDLETTNLVLEYDLGWASLVSSTSWVDEFAVRNLDATQIFGVPAVHLQGNEANALFQEVRLSSRLGGRVQFIAGLFYEDIDRRRHLTNQFSGDPALNPFEDVNLVSYVQQTSKEQKAVFGEVTYDVTDTLAATVGARFFDYEATDQFVNSGALLGSDSHAIEAEQGQNSYKVNLSYEPTADAMVYAQWAQGFRLGYPDQPFIPAGCDVDQDGLIDGSDVSTGLSAIKSDFLDSYELGGKFRLLDNRLSLQAAVYRTDWRDMPVLTFFECEAEVTRNLGEARSQGAELSVAWQLRSELKVEVGASYTDAEASKTVEGLGEDGDRLPGSPRYSYNLGLQYDFGIGDLDSFIEWSLAYRGKLYAELAERGIPAGDYYLMNARWGVNVGKANVAVFGNNLMNENGLIWVSQVYDGRVYRVRPRTVGLELAYRF